MKARVRGMALGDARRERLLGPWLPLSSPTTAPCGQELNTQ